VDTIRITGISIYPIKSTAGIPIDQCAVEAQGLAMDRRWMLVDDNGDCLTGREFPILTQVRAQLGNEGLRVTAPGMSELPVPFPTNTASAMSVTVWDDSCRALSADDAVDDWFATLLGARCRLVFMGDTRIRAVDSEFGRPADRVSFADGYPLLLISQASLDDLNTRLPQAVGMRRFRPNLVVAGCAAYEEDRWRTIRVGETQFEGVKNCARCVFTTIDPANGEKHPRQEPLRTLGGYRRTPDGGVLFGQNLIPRTLGTIRVGDALTVNDSI